MLCGCNELSVLSGPPENGGNPGGATPTGGLVATPWGALPVPSGLPPGVSDFSQLATQATQLANGETGAKRQLLTQAATIASAALPIPVAGWVVALGSVVFGAILSFLGIRGRTQHLNTQQSQEQTNRWIATVIKPTWDALPVDGKKKMYELVANWQEGMWRTYSNEWGGVISRDLSRWFPWSVRDPSHVQGGWAFLDRGEPGPVWDEIYNTAYGFLWRILILSDAEHLQDEVFPDFSGFYNNDVLLPLNNYMVSQYNLTLDQYRALGGSAPTTPGTAGIGTGALIAGGAVLALLAFSTPGRK